MYVLQMVQYHLYYFDIFYFPNIKKQLMSIQKEENLISEKDAYSRAKQILSDSRSCKEKYSKFKNLTKEELLNMISNYLIPNSKSNF